MQYKTMTLGLIEAQPHLYRRLRTARQLLPALDGYARDLRASHQAWTDRLARDRPGDDRRSLASAALEKALAELADRLAREGSPDGPGDAP